MSQDVATFLIVHRDATGTPDSIYPWNEKPYACVVTSINVCRAMLQYVKIRAALVSLAREYNRSVSNAWYSEAHHGFETIESVVLAFLQAILTVFPTVYIDDSLDNPSCLGASIRHAWYDEFEPRKQSILVNGARVRDMVSAVTRAGQTPENLHYDNTQFRTFVFIFANMFLHEMGHLLITFLTKGQTATPLHMGAQTGGYALRAGNGEAGRNLETIIFGGTIEYYRDHTHGAEQSGIPYIVTPHGARRVSQYSIDATMLSRIHSPYHLEGAFQDPIDMVAIGYEHRRYLSWTDPMDWLEMEELRRLGRTVLVGPESALAQLPFYPDLRARGA